jgi:hypothetical protein
LGPGAPLTITDYFRHYIPRQRGGNNAQGTTPLHIIPQACREEGCGLMANTVSISVAWPQMLHLVSDMSTDSHIPNPVDFTNRLSIVDEDGSNVTYELIARILYRKDHFTAQLRFNNSVYSYNDIGGGKLCLENDPTLLQHKNTNSVFYLYHRTSAKATVRLKLSFTK